MPLPSINSHPLALDLPRALGFVPTFEQAISLRPPPKTQYPSPIDPPDSSSHTNPDPHEIPTGSPRTPKHSQSSVLSSPSPPIPSAVAYATSNPGSQIFTAAAASLTPSQPSADSPPPSSTVSCTTCSVKIVPTTSSFSVASALADAGSSIPSLSASATQSILSSILSASNTRSDKFSMLMFRTCWLQSDAKSSPRKSSLKIDDSEKNDSGVTGRIDEVVNPPAGAGYSVPSRLEATTESLTTRPSDHNSHRQTTSTSISSSADVFRDPSSGLPYLWAPVQNNNPPSTPSISSSEIPWQLSVVHVHSNSSQESWSSSEELTPLYSPVVL
ncbi:hypothetical protein NLI96_g10345 [Meripilus lineatus]|uniref:Uncharacterized protein n=1 Tax=Meripilus lineatus TaxID=2056292 RepID=A0AAD5UTU6_9APHY|nr:hypothetical protein NLI96_g10345 [Physisporinus lineatus]